MGRFDGKRALVTGDASGIGLGTAELLAAEGARVAVLDRDVPSGATGGLEYFAADVTDDAAVREAVARALEVLGGLEVLVTARYRRAGPCRGQRRRRVAPRVRCQRRRHGARQPGMPAGPACVRPGGHSKRRFHRGTDRSA